MLICPNPMLQLVSWALMKAAEKKKEKESAKKDAQ